LTHRLLTELTR